MTEGERAPDAMPWGVVLASAALLAITTGSRQTLGLFVRPLAATGLGIATISLVLAIGQFFWGASQPVFGLLAERVGTYRVIAAGGLLLAAGFGLAPVLTGGGGLLVSLGILSAVGGGAASFAILIGAVSQRVPVSRQPMAAAWVNAGASLGQLIFAPIAQAIITLAGWAVAMWSLAGAALLTLLIARPATRPLATDPTSPAGARRQSVAELVRPAFGSRDYWFLHLGFFTCGFHIAFLVTHLPGEVELCGLAPSAASAALAVIGLTNVAGTVAIGWLTGRLRLRVLLVGVYAARVGAIGLYLLAPKTLFTLYAFATVLGLTWLATVPLTSALVGRLFGARHVPTLFGLTVFSHQIGAFFGAWLGGIAVSLTGTYTWIWGLDMALAAAAALITVPIRESMVPVPAIDAARA
jgi:predicted MFS family arabinose efflux permease